jgi:plastocyanin
MVIATTITAFHVVGIMLAAWAVIVAALGTFRQDFPGKGGGEKVVIAISVVLVVGAIGTAIGSSGEEKPKGSEQAGAANKNGKEGSGAPAQGGTPAPSTGAPAGQSPPAGKTPPAGQTAQTLQLAANPTGQLSFDKTTLAAKAGLVRIVLSNPAPVPHNISLEGAGVNQQGKTVPKGGTSQVSVKLKPGNYTFYCSVPGHRQAGMQGTLTVAK